MSNGKPKVEIPAWQRAGAQPIPAPADDPVYSQPQPEANSDTDKPQYAMQSEDFDTFKQQQQQEALQRTPPAPRQQERPPPIITYPEFLVEAHKPPPLVTPGRVVNALYMGGAMAAIMYGASKWLLQPMVETLSEARHDFFSHTQTKMDELNERLANIASTVPEPKSDKIELDDEEESVTSDPTELYHRDMGTQTSPLPSGSPSVGAEVTKDMVTHAEDTLKIIKEHINELANGSEKAGESHRERRESVNNLRNYLDGLIYGSAGGPTWTQSEDAIMMKKNGTDAATREDAIEVLKKEIRGVKGVLLSAKRFPAVSRPVGAAA